MVHQLPPFATLVQRPKSDTPSRLIIFIIISLVHVANTVIIITIFKWSTVAQVGESRPMHQGQGAQGVLAISEAILS